MGFRSKEKNFLCSLKLIFKGEKFQGFLSSLENVTLKNLDPTSAVGYNLLISQRTVPISASFVE